MDLDSDFEIIVGTYEQFVLGYKFIKSAEGEKLTQSFASHSHQGTVKSVATSDKWLASSSTDETIHLYDMSSRKECGVLMEQNGTITCVSFTPDSSYLICTSDDGSISIFKTGSWQMENLWKSAHKGTGVTHIAIHPSGKMALSLGKDKTLRTWNLVKGRPVYTTNLSRSTTVMEFVVWSKCGDYYAIPMNTSVELFSVSVAGVTHVFQRKSRVTTALFISDKVLCLGEESGELSGQCIETGLELWSITGDKRIRGLAVHGKFLITGCSTGSITVYKISSFAEAPTVFADVHAGCRITCLTICVPQHKERKKKRKIKGNTNENIVIEQNGNSSNVEDDSQNVKRKRKSSVKCFPMKQVWDVSEVKS